MGGQQDAMERLGARIREYRERHPGSGHLPKVRPSRSGSAGSSASHISSLLGQRKLDLPTAKPGEAAGPLCPKCGSIPVYTEHGQIRQDHIWEAHYSFPRDRTVEEVMELKPPRLTGDLDYD